MSGSAGFHFELSDFDNDRLSNWASRQPYLTIGRSPSGEVGAIGYTYTSNGQAENTVVLTAIVPIESSGKVQAKQFYYNKDDQLSSVGFLGGPDWTGKYTDVNPISITNFVFKKNLFTITSASYPNATASPIYLHRTEPDLRSVQHTSSMEYRKPYGADEQRISVAAAAFTGNDKSERVFLFESLKPLETSPNGRLIVRESDPESDRDPQFLEEDSKELATFKGTAFISAVSLSGKVHVIINATGDTGPMILTYDGTWNTGKPVVIENSETLPASWCGTNLIAFQDKMYYMGYLSDQSAGATHEPKLMVLWCDPNHLEAGWKWAKDKDACYGYPSEPPLSATYYPPAGTLAAYKDNSGRSKLSLFRPMYGGLG
ncbi:hypothetical protein [Mycobacteroides abscessus]|uniref:hypothetical protein n=1 Tax=Mycobacteroides abscessus TaxID=36809 RepID=UPI0012FFE4AA|nr:hypothetical protein [Mycobacteroides abscessus]